MATRVHRRVFVRLAAGLFVLAAISATSSPAQAQWGWRRAYRQSYGTAPRYYTTTTRNYSTPRYYTTPRYYYTTPRTNNGWGNYRYATPRRYYSGPPVYFAPPML
jgi:hypothetical protein